MLPGKTISVQYAMAVLRRRWWLLAIPACIGLMAGLIMSSRVRDAYQSEMLIQIVPQRVPDRFIPNTVTERTEDRMEALEAQLKSRSQLEQLIHEFSLYPEERKVAAMEDLVNRMRAAIGIELLRPNRMMPPNAFYVRYTYDDPGAAAKVTARLGAIFVDMNAGERVKSAESTSEFLMGQLSEAKAKLESHETKMEQFRLRHAGRLPSQSGYNLEAIRTTQSNLQAVIESAARDRDRKLMLERLYNEAVAEPAPIAAAPPQAVPSSDPTDGMLPIAQQLELARANVARLELRLTPEHPDLRRARRLVEELSHKAEVERQRTKAAEPSGDAAQASVTVTLEQAQRRERLRQMQAEIESLARQITFKEGEEQRLRRIITDYQAKLEAIPGIESEWVSLTRDYETLTDTYRDLLQKTENSKVAADLERRNVGEQFRVLDPARVPVRPVGPVRLQINGIGLGAGLALGLLAVAFLELRDRTFRAEADILDVLALPVLALVPRVDTAADKKRLTRIRLAVTAIAVASTASAAYVFWSLRLWKHIM